MNMLNVKILLTGTVYNDGSRTNQEGLFLFRHFINFVTYLLKTFTHLLRALDPHRADKYCLCQSRDNINIVAVIK